MGFLLLIAFSIYGLECMCDSLECNRGKNTLDDRPEPKVPRFDENPEPESRAKRPASSHPPVRPGTGTEGIAHRTADKDTDGEDSIDELEYMRHFFH